MRWNIRKLLAIGNSNLAFTPFPCSHMVHDVGLSIGSQIISLSWSKNNAYLLVAAVMRPLQIYCLKYGRARPVHLITAIDGATVALFSRTHNKIIAIGTSLCTVGIYDTQSKSLRTTYPMPSAVVSIDFNARDRFIGVACADGETVLIDVTTDYVHPHFTTEAPVLLRFHPHLATYYAVATRGGHLYVFNITETNPMWRLESTPLYALNGFVFYQHAGRELLLAISDSGQFFVYDWTDGACVFRCQLGQPLTGIDATVDGRLVAIAVGDGEIAFYDTNCLLSPLAKMSVGEERLTALRFCNVGALPPLTRLLYGEQLHTQVSVRHIFKVLRVRTSSTLLSEMREELIECIAQRAFEFADLTYKHMDQYQECAFVEFDKLDDHIVNYMDTLLAVRTAIDVVERNVMATLANDIRCKDESGDTLGTSDNTTIDYSDYELEDNEETVSVKSLRRVKSLQLCITI